MKTTSKIQRQIERAEAKGTIDLTLAAEQHEAGARAFLDFLHNADVPAFLQDVLLDAVVKASMIVGVEAPNYDEPRREQIKALADLFRRSLGNVRTNLDLCPAPDPDSIEAFASHLSEVLRLARDGEIVNPDFYNHIRDPFTSFVTDEALQDTDEPEFITFALKCRALREQKKGGR
jgi:hypothetical protein